MVDETVEELGDSSDRHNFFTQSTHWCALRRGRPPLPATHADARSHLVCLTAAPWDDPDFSSPEEMGGLSNAVAVVDNVGGVNGLGRLL